MQLELKDDEGLIGTIELPLEELKEALGLGSASVAEPAATEALKVEAQLKESQGKVGELEGKLAVAEGKTMGDFTPVEKANFVIAWAKGISPEDKAIFAQAVGIPIAGASAAEVADVEGEPAIIEGRTDKPGYRFLEYLNLSMRE